MQLAVHLALVAGFVGLVAWLVVLHARPAAIVWTVPTLGLITRVVVLIRMRRMGWFDAETPSPAMINRETSKIFAVQLVGWVLAAAYFAATGTWLALGAAALATISLTTMKLLRRPPSRPGRTE